MLEAIRLNAEKTRKKKSMRTSVIIHIIILLLAIYPFLEQVSSYDFDRENAIVIEFDFSPQAASSKNAVERTRAGEPTKSEAAPQNSKVETPSQIQQSKPQVDQVQRPQQKIQVPVLTDPFENEVEVTEVESPAENPQKLPEPSGAAEPVEEAIEKPVVAVEKPSTTSQNTSNNSDPFPALEELIFEEESGSGSGKSDGNLPGNRPGEGGTDNSSSRASSGSGNRGNGGFGDGLFGDGALTRQVVKRGPIKSAIKREGKVNFRICVNRAGRVTSATPLRKGSTILDPNYQKLATETMKGYLFEEDNSAPAVQCGNFTFVFKLNK